ncbi:phosphoglycolate phosphatase-like HAD superfamily hydrolase [Neisseria perflava]|uniref:HAD family hydrolase n=1 Tax=Neisseria perflava TaxID=33053 RepID=UPI00209DF9FF|nr:phosphoglycolate phosphatase-like HAD superfamily hydrolase [Neisseria perflava]
MCVDSDGCAMDTMNIKHEKCFGPLAAEAFGITDVPRFIEIWNKVNLFSATRGTNRFKGLIYTLQQYGYEGDFSTLTQWVETSPELSNRALAQQIEKTPSKDLSTALAWSEAVNKSIKTLRGNDAPFPNARRSLEFVHQFADVAVVSSANNEAIVDEWNRHALMPNVDLVYGQEEGSKAYCLGLLKQYGYEGNKILMVGDSPGDLDAAKSAGTLFFPILFNHEDASWDELVLKALGKLVNGEFDEAYQADLVNCFNQNMAG